VRISAYCIAPSAVRKAVQQEHEIAAAVYHDSIVVWAVQHCSIAGSTALQSWQEIHLTAASDDSTYSATSPHCNTLPDMIKHISARIHPHI
jgi:hypothetical protein